MHLPYIQLERAAMERARPMARLLGVTAKEGVGLLVGLHDWAISAARDGDFSGAIRDRAPREMMALNLEWPTEDAPRLWDAFERFGFVQSADAPGNVHACDRVRGLDRYQRAWTKNRRRTRKTSESSETTPGRHQTGNMRAETGNMRAETGALDVDVDVDVDVDGEGKGKDLSARRRRTPSRRRANRIRTAETAQTADGSRGETPATGTGAAAHTDATGTGAAAHTDATGDTPAAHNGACVAEPGMHGAHNGACDGAPAAHTAPHAGVHDDTTPHATPPATGALLSVSPAPRARPEDLQAAWNELRAPEQPRWLEMSDARRKLCAVRLRERPIDGPTGWRAAIERIAASPFCKGDNDRGWAAGPEFLLKPDTAARALEGQYDARERPRDVRTGVLRADAAERRYEPEGEFDIWPELKHG